MATLATEKKTPAKISSFYERNFGIIQYLSVWAFTITALTSIPLVTNLKFLSAMESYGVSQTVLSSTFPSLGDYSLFALVGVPVTLCVASLLTFTSRKTYLITPALVSLYAILMLAGCYFNSIPVA